MGNAFASIPPPYMRLALASDIWFYFVAVLAIVIRAMQVFESTVIRLFVTIVLWPFVNFRRSMHDSDSMIVEHISASAAGLLAAWLHWGREPDVAYRALSAIAPVPVVISLSLVLCVVQFHSSSQGTVTRRGVLSVFACAWWTIITLVLIHHAGFFLVHVFSLPLMLACGLSVWALYEKVDSNGPTGNAKPTVE